jgi:hypothetical protein
VSFQYRYHCTDEVIEQLALHCIQLKKVDISNSPAVTDDCVDHLLKLKKLVMLNVLNTSMSSESYSSLISALPKISNIIWSLPVCDVLESTSAERLYTISNVSGPINNTNILTLKCPYIRLLALISVFEDLSSLTALNMLTEIYIQRGGYERCNMRFVLEGVGHRLEKLQFEDVFDVRMAEIVTLCSCLKVLILEYCTCDSTDLDTVITRDLPHFRSVRKISIIGNENENDLYYEHLGFYVNLEEFFCKGVNNLSDDFIAEAVENGAFKNIEYFDVDGTHAGVLSMSTVFRLLNNSNHLEIVGSLGTWSNVTPESIIELETVVKLQNLDLQILEY